MNTTIEQQFVQLSFNLDKEEVSKEENLYEKFFSRNGVYIKLNSIAVFVNEDGSYENLPHEALRPKYIYVDSPKRNRSIGVKRKSYSDFPSAVRAACIKLKDKKIGAGYFISVEYDDKPEYSQYLGRLIGQSVIYIQKTKDSIELRKDFDCFNYNGKILTLEERKFIKENNHLPDSWISKERNNPIVKKYIDRLKTEFNVNSICFVTHLSEIKKIDYLENIVNYYEILTKVVNVHLFPSVNIVLENIRTASADYSPNTCTIRLRLDCLISLFHEYFHHIDYKNVLRYDVEEVGQKAYNQLVESLKNSETLLQLEQESQRYFDEFKQQIDKKPNDYYMYNKYVESYNYKFSIIEITARFFSDYMKYYYVKNKYAYYDYKTVEIENFKHLLETFIKKAQDVSENKELFVSKYKVHLKK